ncbi:hypothetical protein KCU70_g174, partial [Aureobasidium melanogenum]
MSFGFGVGDFLAVAETSKKIWDRFDKSPSYVQDAQQERGCRRFCRKSTSPEVVRDLQRLTYDEQDMARARSRIRDALSRLDSGLRTIDSQLVRQINSGVERTEASVKRTEIGVEHARAGVEQLHKRENARDQSVERQRILTWICPSEVDYTDQQNALKSRRRRGIGEWFLDTQKFKSWLHGDRTTLLCSGMPGVGKTMITSFVVGNLLERYNNDNQVGIAYIYCQFSRHKEQTPEYLMSSILRQLLEQQNTIPNKIRSLYMSNAGKHSLAPDEVSDLLYTVLSLFKKSILVIDALDELRSSARNGLMSDILTIQQKSNVNVYVTSRYTKDIAQEIPNATQVNIRAREDDLRCNLAIILERGSLLRKRPDLQKQALSKILRVADGIFLLAVLYAEHLAEFELIGDLVDALESLKPVSDPYGDLYTSAMQRLQAGKTGNTSLGLTTISWLFFAKRPLRLKELLHALAIAGNNPQVGKNIPAIPHVLNACAGLIVVDETNNTVEATDSISPLRVRFTALARSSDANKLSASCQTLKSLAPRTTGAHFAVIHSLNHSLKRYLKLHRPQLNVKDDLGRSPLSYAAELGNLVAATLLIKAGADPKIEDNEPAHWVDWSIEAYNPLSYAAAKGHLRMTEFLLKAGAYVNNQDYRGRSALLCAAKGGSEDVVKLLLQHGSEPDFRDSKDRTPLFYAAAAGSAEASSLLLNRGANINHADSRGVTPLLLAARAGSEQVIALLIAKGAKVNPKCADHDTPLSRAVEAKLIDSIRLLLRAGAEVDVYTSPLDPLSQACKTGPKEIVRLLLSAGGDVKHMNCRHVPPLAYAVRNGWADIAQLFLDKSAAADTIDTNSRSVLSYAVESGSTACVELLLKNGAQINRPNPKISFCEQLYYALGMVAYNSGDRRPANESMLNLLLSRGANPNKLIDNPRSALDDSPLFYALKYLPAGEKSTRRIIELLVKYRAEVAQRDEKGRSVLTCAKHHGADVQNLLRQHVVRYLVGCNIMVRFARLTVQ